LKHENRIVFQNRVVGGDEILTITHMKACYEPNIKDKDWTPLIWTGFFTLLLSKHTLEGRKGHTGDYNRDAGFSMLKILTDIGMLEYIVIGTLDTCICKRF